MSASRQNAEAEEAAFDLEELAQDGPMVVDSGEWEWLAMERETDPNELIHDPYTGCRG
jgi:hypothetical protein